MGLISANPFYLLQVCLALSNPGASGCKPYTTVKGDTCVAIAKKTKTPMANIKPQSICQNNPIKTSTTVCAG